MTCFYSVAGGSSRLPPAMEDTLSKDELRMRLFNTFKNKGVLDKLKVSHILKTIGCLPLQGPVYWKVIFLIFLRYFDLDSAAKPAHSGAKVPSVKWSWTHSSSSSSKVWSHFNLCLQQHSGRSSQDLWVWVYPVYILSWMWPKQQQGEHL